MTLVIDASVAVAALVDSGPDGRWAESLLTTDLAAPHLLAAEVTNVLRRAVTTDQITDAIASLAYADFAQLRLQLVDYSVVAGRVWELRHNLSAYDAWYVAAAELLDAPLATLDRRLVNAPGPTCQFLTPD